MSLALHSSFSTPTRPFKYKIQELFKPILQESVIKEKIFTKREETTEEIFAQTQEALHHFNYQNSLSKTHRLYA